MRMGLDGWPLFPFIPSFSQEGVADCGANAVACAPPVFLFAFGPLALSCPPSAAVQGDIITTQPHISCAFLFALASPHLFPSR